MSDKAPALLVGNNLAVLVAADALLRKGRAVTLLTDGKALGGHFAGTRVDGHDFDIGMVLLERPAGTGPSPSAIDYRAEVRNDWTRFSPQVAAWMDERMAPRRVPTPTVQVDGRFGPDYLIANRLDLLAGTRMSAQPLIDRGDPRHAIHKTAGPVYDSLSYADAALANHGAAWHERYIEPFVRKLLDASSSDFLARFHRAGWVPLYYPETLASACRGEPVLLPEYPFHMPQEGLVGTSVAALADRVVQAAGCRVLRAPVQSLHLANGAWQVQCDGEVIGAQRLVLGLAPERCQALLRLPAIEPQRATSVALIFALVRSSDIGRALSCHMVVDEDFCTYRVCDQDALAGRDTEWHRVVLEASPRCLAARAALDDGPSVQAVLAEELRSLMHLPSTASVRPLKSFVARNALVLPTAAAVASHRATSAALAEVAPGARLTGTLLGYGVASFNDQIVQGLQIAQELE
ncbi:hypothetical protein V4F39_19540 [Aquincola sp. MAHUQ-54]|uniref:FAD-dependent oxidoreductase n=1 Tax=Aquincola agrisoli TaxID=3119538 RepID=A0AAW9QH15_9BURK